MQIDGNMELYLLVECGICLEETECNQRGESKILTDFRLFIIEF